MCYSLQASKDAFIICIINCIILYNIKSNSAVNKISALFLLYVNLMQLYDWIFWANPSKSRINYLTTKIAMITNILQPVVIAGILYYYNNKLSGNSIKLLIIYLLFVLFFIYDVYNKIDYTLVSKESAPGLFWQWNNIGYSFIWKTYIILFIVLSLENCKYPFNYYGIAIIMSTIILGLLYYKQDSFGRFWCYFASYIPLILNLINFILYS